MPKITSKTVKTAQPSSSAYFIRDSDLKGFALRVFPSGCPHLNGKVERSQKTDKTEFYPTFDLRSNELDDLLAEWQHYYNWERPHSANNGKTPIDKYLELSEDTPFSDEAFEDFDPVKERYQNANYKIDLELKRLKRCL